MQVFTHFDIVRDVVEHGVAAIAQEENLSTGQVLESIWEQLEGLSAEYWSDDPDIDYANPLCQLGYLYRYATADATAFERAIIQSESIKTLRGGHDRVLNVCAVGGGPGTELLGLAKVLMSRPHYL